MKRYDLITPEGTRDLLFEECLARRTAASATFRLWVNLFFESRSFRVEMISSLLYLIAVKPLFLYIFHDSFGYKPVKVLSVPYHFPDPCG